MGSHLCSELELEIELEVGKKFKTNGKTYSYLLPQLCVCHGRHELRASLEVLMDLMTRIAGSEEEHAARLRKARVAIRQTSPVANSSVTSYQVRSCAHSKQKMPIMHVPI